MRTFAVSLMLAGALAAQDAEWSVGLAAVKITPEEPIPLSGYANRKEAFERVEGDLFAKALALRDRDGKRALLITADLIGFANLLSERICTRIAADTGLPRESILLNTSHTHTGPVVAPEMAWPPVGELEPKVRAYVARLEDKVVTISKQALGSMAPARLDYAVGVALFPMNRREVTPKGVVLGVNPRGPADRSAPVLRVQSPDGKLRAVVFGAAGHNVTPGAVLRVSGDYAGFAQAEIEKQYPGAQAMFVLGCAGDANIHPKGTLDIAQEHGRALAAEVARIVEGKGMKAVRGPLRTVFRRVDLPLKQYTRAQIEAMGKSSWEQFFAQRALADLDAGKPLPKVYNAPMAVWQFGQDLTLVAISGEVVVEYALELERRLGALGLWVAGYSNDVYGYLPSARILAEGGYETRGVYMGYGMFDAAVEEVVLKALVGMAREAGRR